jgi:hypothetical protein
MDKPPPKRAIARRAGISPAALTPADEAALAAGSGSGQESGPLGPCLARQRGQLGKFFAQWCSAHDFVPLPAAPAIVGACLASLCGSHTKTTHPLAVVGHRQNGLGSDQGYARGRVDAATADG